ncbi:tyrosine-type recombinase/integrase [Streptomyces sp. NPDC004629]|uniref:tyrosine-type recombinase/integrase n=1 Tax=Streptomyces sp. NPDC004629 TaxID=3364705 RepID=UPI0036CBBEB5
MAAHSGGGPAGAGPQPCDARAGLRRRALRREELCSLRTDDLDPAHRTLRIRAETTKNRLEPVVPCSASTGVLMSAYLAHRATVSRARGPLFLSESRRNYAQPLSLWTWSKVVRQIAVTAGVPRFSTHTTRHLCLTDLARMGWELHAIATFAGHRHTGSTLQYIHLSGRDLAVAAGSRRKGRRRMLVLADRPASL